MAGQVRLGPGDARAAKPGQLVDPDVELGVDAPPPYVSRGGIKLRNALDALGVDPAGRRCLDVGASTGGFTDCLLQAGAEHVVALDVAYGELDWALREDPRVTVIERANARALQPDQLPYAPDLIVLDVSFISLRKVLPGRARRRAAERFDALAMVKPQFEAGREHVSRGGVVRDPEARRAALGAVAACGAGAGRRGARLRLLGAARPGGQPRDVRVAGRGRARRAPTSRRCWRRSTREGRRPHPPPPQRRLRRRPRRAGRLRAARRTPRSSSTPTRRASTSSSRGGHRARRGHPHRRRPLHRARRRRHDPDRAARVRGHGRPGVRDQLRRGRLPRHARPRRARGATSTARSPASSSASTLPTIDVGRPDGTLDRHQRHLRPPQAGHARRRPRLRPRGGGDRARALRRARGRHARRARRATTSPTAARCWRGACAASSSPSSPRTR